MTVALVQSTGIQTGNNVASDAATFGSNVTAGNHIFTGVAIWRSGSAGMDDVTDNQGNNHIEDREQTSTNSSVSLYSTKAASTGSLTVTLDPTGATGNYISWASVEFSGLDTTTHLDQVGSGTSTTGDATVTASSANTTANGVAIALAAVVGDSDTDINIGDTPPTGYTNIAVYEDSFNIIGFSMVYKIYSSSETSAASWTHDNVDMVRWLAVIGTYKAASGGGGGVAGPLIGGHLVKRGILQGRLVR